MIRNVAHWRASPRLDRSPRGRQPSKASAALGVLLLLLVSVVPVGCEATQPPQNDGVTSGQFQDVVVPGGFRLQDDAHQSHSREEAGWRMGRFFYTGSSRVAEAADYVRQRMPQHNWKLVSEEVVDEATTKLRFVRGHYTADYAFLRQEGVTQMVVDYQTDYTRR